MNENIKLEEELTNFIHDLFLDKDYLQWRLNLKDFTPGKWNSLIAKLDKYGSSLDRIKSFGTETYSKLVYSYIESPDYKESKMLMIQFTVSGSMWNSIVWHCPERN